jgi:hypothetical protein
MRTIVVEFGSTTEQVPAVSRKTTIKRNALTHIRQALNNSPMPRRKRFSSPALKAAAADDNATHVSRRTGVHTIHQIGTNH